MDILERREHGGTWWGRTGDGAWFRWSPSSNAWEGPLAPPWPPEERTMTEEEEDAIVAAALATTASPEGPSMNRVDRWWNRAFPPFSKKRLVFGLAVLPVFGGLQELVIWSVGWKPSLPRYLFVCIAGGIMLSVAFLPGMREMAEQLAVRPGAVASPWGWSRRRDPAPPEPPPPPLDTNLRRDFLIALPFALVIVLVMSLTVAGSRRHVRPVGAPDERARRPLHRRPRRPADLRVGARALLDRRWSARGGFMLLLSAMTFSDPGGDFLIGWAIGSVLLFLYAFPMWRWLRHLEARGFRLPMWLVMGGSVVLVSGSALVFVAEH